MTLPNNGKVVIIDDTPDEVADLMDALTREKMPFLFFKDLGMGDLPDDPIRNVRLLFLDFDLGLGGNSPIEKIRLIQQRMVRIMEKKTPYILVIWSDHEDECSQTLMDEFKGGFKDYAPIETCSLHKHEIKEKKRKGEKVIELLRANLKENLAKYNSFNLFLLWESIVNDSCGRSVNDLVNSFDGHDDWNKSLTTTIKKLAHAYLGKRIEDSDKIAIQKSAMYTFNELFKESLEKDILKSSGVDDLGFEDVYPTDVNLVAKLNSKLLFEAESTNGRCPGNVYVLSEEVKTKIIHEIKDKTKTPWIYNIISRKALGDIFTENYNKENNGAVPTNKQIKDFVTETVTSVTDKCILVELEITPICDFAQKKRILSRSVKGCLFPYGEIDSRCYLSKTDYLYTSPLIEFKEKKYKLVIDFRLFSADFITEENQESIFRLRYQLLVEIQINAAKHVSRTGITFLDERDA